MLVRVLCVVAALSLTAFAPAPFPRPDRKTDLEKMAGTWTVVRYNRGRQSVFGGGSPALKVSVTGKKWSFFREGAGGKVPSAQYDIKIDPTKKPRWVDMDFASTKMKLVGIFRWKDGDLHVSFSIANTMVNGRPTEFDGGDARVYYMTLKRDKGK
jgi:uncharacterized protein (TIGR03067 family)